MERQNDDYSYSYLTFLLPMVLVAVFYHVKNTSENPKDQHTRLKITLPSSKTGLTK